jgi:hypothetical protein
VLRAACSIHFGVADSCQSSSALTNIAWASLHPMRAACSFEAHTTCTWQLFLTWQHSCCEAWKPFMLMLR